MLQSYFYFVCITELYGQYLTNMLATMVCYYGLRLDPFLTQWDCFQHTLRVCPTDSNIASSLVFVELEYCYIICCIAAYSQCIFHCALYIIR